MRPFRALAGAVAVVRGVLDSGSACGAVQQGLPCWRARNAPAGVAGQWLSSGSGVAPLPCARPLHSTAAVGSSSISSSSSSTTAADRKQQQQQQQQQPPQPQQSKLSRSQGRSAGRSQGRVGGNHTISPQLLTALIKCVGSLDALQQLEAQHDGSFDHIHAAAAFTRAAHLASSGAARPLDAHPLLHRLSARLWPLLDDFGTRQLANTLWACGKTAYVDAALLDACFERLAAGAGEAAPQGLANALYAGALLQTAGYNVDRRHAAQLLSALVAQRQDATPQALANALWAAATLQLRVSEQHAAQLLSALVAQRQDAKPQELANALWAAAKQWSDAVPPDVEVALLRLAAAVDERLVAAMNGQDVSNSLWALSQLGLRPAPLTQRLADVAMPLAPAMTPQHLANTALAAAKLGVGGTVLFAALAGAAGRQLQGFTTQNLCNLAWALAIADQRQLAGAAVALAQRAATAEVWAQTVAEDHGQLHQVHVWLMGLDGRGLSGALSPAQLRECEAAWEARPRGQPAASKKRRAA